MPELPEVETVVRGLTPVWEGRILAAIAVQRGDLRHPLPTDFAAHLHGRTMQRLGRRGKYLQVFLNDGQVLLGHLGMSGRMTIHREAAPVLGKHDHIRFTTDQGVVVDYNDPRRFGGFALTDAAGLDNHPFLSAMGPEPLSNHFSPAVLEAGLTNRRSPIKVALLDQTLVAGLGNIYVCESLFAAGINPQRPACSLNSAECARLYEAIVDVLRRAIAAGGSSLRDYRQADGNLGYFQHNFTVYGREGEPCPGCTCAQGIVRTVQGGRSTFYCAVKQK